jgi:hypothetical protein
MSLNECETSFKTIYFCCKLQHLDNIEGIGENNIQIQTNLHNFMWMSIPIVSPLTTLMNT